MAPTPSHLAAELERLLKRARSVGSLGHPAVQEHLDELWPALRDAAGGGELELVLDGGRVLHGGAEVFVAPEGEPPVLGAAHRDGIRSLVFLPALGREELGAAVEALARAARRAKAAPFTAPSLLAERLYDGLRWTEADGARRGGPVEAAAEGAAEGWFFGEPIPPQRLEDLPPPKKR